MSWIVVLCPDCGKSCGGYTRGDATAAWRMHFIDVHFSHLDA